jgi:hypothetical protein
MSHPVPVSQSSSAPRPVLPWFYGFYLRLLSQWEEAIHAGSDEAVFLAFMIGCTEKEFPELRAIRQEEEN